MRTRCQERGAAAVEFIGVVPAIILAAVIALQLGIVGWSVVSAADAARAGARAASVNVDPQLAAERALPGRLAEDAEMRGSHGGGGFRYTVSVRIPSIVPGITLPRVDRSADMPNLGD